MRTISIIGLVLIELLLCSGKYVNALLYYYVSIKARSHKHRNAAQTLCGKKPVATR